MLHRGLIARTRRGRHGSSTSSSRRTGVGARTRYLGSGFSFRGAVLLDVHANDPCMPRPFGVIPLLQCVSRRQAPDLALFGLGPFPVSLLFFWRLGVRLSGLELIRR